MKTTMKTLLAVSVFLFLSACVSAPKGPQTLELKAPVTTTYTAYRSTTKTQEYEGDQLVREKTEAVDFIVEKKPAAKDSEAAKTDQVAMILTTVAKNGTLDLHDYGFPELKESIEFIYTPFGDVIKAGSFNRQSLFFVPPLPLPRRAVEQEDTWELSHNWVSASGMELNLKVVGIHKGFKRCGEDGPCADVEISGSVQPVADRVAGLEMNSRISGNLLFSLKEGDVTSSKVKSRETLQFPNRRVESSSCMVSLPVDQASLKDVSFPKCN